ncbi:uncharacterized protein LOC129903739 [Solanum dulcamara]|uniref:uncharacterized protein LOC129903739 n=1 Tax=Solanum dulcamara TaxID=45834 RepID=UPI0024863A66|nr:uncharacterized protein LOC129903739 [Solanum dulcamara]
MGESKEAKLDSDGVLKIEGKIGVPKMGDLIRLILEKAHCSRYSIHQKYVPDESHVISLDSVELGPDLTFVKVPIANLDRLVHKLRTKYIDSVKVQWKHCSFREATWESENDMRAQYP